ncbi:unnamed protein product [Cylindrotheca closterium]|uniref:protein-serine/threonine phosphatase n=1 Tax=Cylindrotheca closterium TaxID=2856 RepID=A0AAD2G759_9STRA|nr:unnamed protein product [Cylindrotheca closterium]
MFDSLLTNFPSIFGGDGYEEQSGKVAVTAKDTIRGVVNECGIQSFAFSGMQGWRLTMEDAHMACSPIPVHNCPEPLSEGHAIFGVFDGHGGDFTSEFAAANFLGHFSRSAKLRHYIHLNSIEQGDVTGISMLRAALKETFVNLDADIRTQQKKKNDKILAGIKKTSANGQVDLVKARKFIERSGSTCAVVLLTPSHIICANAGDSRAILQRGGKVLPLSFDHKPSNIPELQRIENAGGTVKNKRIDGDLAVSRGLGDYAYKKANLRPVSMQKVIPDPEFVVYPRKQDLDEFIVLACDGVWDVATNAECGQFIQGMMDDGHTDIGAICENAIDICLKKNSRDNMTLGVITMDAVKFGTAGLTLGNATRQAKEAAEAATRAAADVASTFMTVK